LTFIFIFFFEELANRRLQDDKKRSEKYCGLSSEHLKGLAFNHLFRCTIAFLCEERIEREILYFPDETEIPVLAN